MRHTLTPGFGQKLGFHGSLESKESACKVGDLASIPGSRRSPGEGNIDVYQIIRYVQVYSSGKMLA